MLHPAGVLPCNIQRQLPASSLVRKSPLISRPQQRIWWQYAATARLRQRVCQSRQHDSEPLDEQGTSPAADGSFAEDDIEGEDALSGWDAALEHIEAGDSEPEPAAAVDTSQQPAPYYEETAYGTMTGIPPRIKPKSATIIRELQGQELQDFLTAEAEANYVQPVVTGRELTADQQAALEAAGGRYRQIQLAKVELLIPEEEDGSIRLADAVLVDGSGRYLVPDLRQGVPAEARLYQLVPWQSTFLGDTLKFKKPSKKIIKLYFLPVHQGQQQRLVDLEEVYCFDGDTSVLSRAPVKRVEPIVDPVLRITKEGLVIEDSMLALDPALVAMSGDYAKGQRSRDGDDGTVEEVLQELDTDLIDDLEEIPDVSAEDLM